MKIKLNDKWQFIENVSLIIIGISAYHYIFKFDSNVITESVMIFNVGLMLLTACASLCLIFLIYMRWKAKTDPAIEKKYFNKVDDEVYIDDSSDNFKNIGKSQNKK